MKLLNIIFFSDCYCCCCSCSPFQFQRVFFHFISSLCCWSLFLARNALVCSGLLYNSVSSSDAVFISCLKIFIGVISKNGPRDENCCVMVQLYMYITVSKRLSLNSTIHSPLIPSLQHHSFILELGKV